MICSQKPRIWFLAGALAGLAFGAAAEQAKYPREVEAALDGARKECASAGGERVDFGLETVKKLDLTGDGRDDYIIDLNGASCIGHEAVYCGTGGCDFSILVAKPGGGYVKIFDQRVRAYEVTGEHGPRRIRFALHGGYCGGHGNPSCYRTRTITAKPFRFVQPE
jgi:hypothetical protein